ncbi:MAG: histidinol-phosphatase [Bacteroidia bacterium]|nr:histidinol-phosphatase [Bacteroidia bacterium]
MTYKTDYHIHTTFSDGKAAPEDYIPAAISAGISEIGFSEHLSLFRENQDWVMNPENVLEYVNYIEDLKKNSDKIIVKTGMEVDFFPGKEKEIELFLGKFKLDYRIGSVHYLGEKTVDLGPEFYEGKNIDALYESYFEHVMAAAASGLFDIIGHCDLIRIYGYKPSYDPEPLYRKLARIMRENNVAFELNTNGRNRPLADFYPDRRFIHVFREENVSVCVNSDAHLPARVGQFFSEAYDLLRLAGYTEMAVFSDRKRKMIPL